MTTSHTLNNEDTIGVVNDLIETCKDGEYGFDACAERTETPDLRMVFQQRATACRQAAAELQTLVAQLGGKAEDGGTVMGALHRGWVATRATLSTYDDLALLEECERGEDRALARYRKALDNPLPEPVQAVIARQMAGARANHDNIRSLRDRARATAR